MWGVTQTVPGGPGPRPCSGRAVADIWGCLWVVPRQGAWLEPSRSARLEEIENLLANDDQELIGDFSKVEPRGWGSVGVSPSFRTGTMAGASQRCESPKRAGGPCLGPRGLGAVTCQPAASLRWMKSPMAAPLVHPCGTAPSMWPFPSRGCTAGRSGASGLGGQVAARGGVLGMGLSPEPVCSSLTSCRRWRARTRA